MKNLKVEELKAKVIEFGIVLDQTILEKLNKDDLIELIECHMIREEVEKENTENYINSVLKEMSSEEIEKECVNRLHLAIVEKRKVQQENSKIKEEVKRIAAEFLRTFK